MVRDARATVKTAKAELDKKKAQHSDLQGSGDRGQGRGRGRGQSIGIALSLLSLLRQCSWKWNSV